MLNDCSYSVKMVTALSTYWSLLIPPNCRTGIPPPVCFVAKFRGISMYLQSAQVICSHLTELIDVDCMPHHLHFPSKLIILSVKCRVWRYMSHLLTFHSRYICHLRTLCSSKRDCIIFCTFVLCVMFSYCSKVSVQDKS